MGNATDEWVLVKGNLSCRTGSYGAVKELMAFGWQMFGQNKATDPDLLFSALGEILNRIERCGVSSELTDVVTLVSDLRQAVGNQHNPGNKYALERVQSLLIGSQPSPTLCNYITLLGETNGDYCKTDRLPEII